MLRALVTQAQRLFSSKKNGGKSVQNLTDRLHGYKQTLLFLSIGLMVGYSQFRSHFECDVPSDLSKDLVTSHCWINGTFTLNSKRSLNSDWGSANGVSDHQNHPLKLLLPHVGIQYKFNDGKYELTNHNYMRSLWALLILMAACSYLAQASWSGIFRNEVLIALLKLPGHEELSIVKKAQERKPLELLTHYRDDKETERKKLSDPLAVMIDVIESDQNEHNHTLDYYVNQLIYLLLVRRTVAYKMSGLKLRRKLITYSFVSFTLTLNQFVLPWLFIGNQYLFYGYRYAKMWVRSMSDMLEGKDSQVNSIDYDISARIWPTVTTCSYRRYGVQGLDVKHIRCFVGINEICGKMFAVIWWVVVINIVIEFVSLLSVLVCSLSNNMVRRTFAFNYWPGARKQARDIATFRYNRQRLCAKQVLHSRQKPEAEEFGAASSELEKKQLEKEAEKRDSRHSLRAKEWYLWCSRDIGIFLGKQGKRLYCLSTRSGSPKEADRYRDSREELNVYYLLYLLYLRLKRSSRKTSRIITLIGDALNVYLDQMRQQLQAASLSEKQQLLTSFEEAPSAGRKSEWLPDTLTLQAQPQSKSSLSVFEDPEAESR